MRTRAPITVLSLICLTGCQNDTGSGALLGAGGGALIGGLAGGWGGAAIGAGAGALLSET